MTDLAIERVLKAPPATVFAYLTQSDHLLKWWGPEGMSVKEHNLDLSQQGVAWFSTLVNAEGGLHNMSGVVTEINAPHSVEFTWGWHDEDGNRGAETRVRMAVRPTGDGGTLLELMHYGLADDEIAANHNRGWSSALIKLERMANS
ncbi:MAG: hypothetical protein ACI8TF_002190 [Paracoccaceae bacterium]|jgi:uncharacterized protein YndB with AHSA1/START domain